LHAGRAEGPCATEAAPGVAAKTTTAPSEATASETTTTSSATASKTTTTTTAAAATTTTTATMPAAATAVPTATTSAGEYRHAGKGHRQKRAQGNNRKLTTHRGLPCTCF